MVICIGKKRWGYHVTSRHPNEHSSCFLAPYDKVCDSSTTLKIGLFLWFLLWVFKIFDLNQLPQFFKVYKFCVFSLKMSHYTLVGSVTYANSIWKQKPPDIQSCTKKWIIITWCSPSCSYISDQKPVLEWHWMTLEWHRNEEEWLECLYPCSQKEAPLGFLI